MSAEASKQAAGAAPVPIRDRRLKDRRRKTEAARWRDLLRPARALAYLLIVLVLIAIYIEARFIVDKIFNVFLLFIFSAIIAMLMNPLVDALQRIPALRGRRGLAVLTLNLLVVVVLGGLVAAMIPSLVSQGTAFGQESPRLAHDFQGWLGGVERGLNQHGIPVNFGVPSNLESLVAPALGSALGILGGTITFFIDIVLITVISLYLEMQGREVIAVLRELFPSQQHVFDFSLVAAGSTLAGYVRGQIIFASVMAIYTGIVLAVIGVHFALVIAVVTFFLELVPMVGAPIAIAVACAIAVLQGPLVILLTAVTTMVGHIVGAYTVGLRVLSRSTRVHPLVALAALLLGAELGGVLGALFAVPIAGILNVYAGALFRARRGQQAFVLPETDLHHESTLDQLPRLGQEITALAEESATGG
jgi:predicted PurR-regulated permease PerM